MIGAILQRRFSGLTMIRIILTLIITVFCASVNARMYQWVDPESGTTQLSGKPPAWYRSGGGPRVFVFENGEIVDDTGVTVSEAERNRLRQQAFLQAEEDKSAAKDKLLEAKKLEAALGVDQKEEEAVAKAEAQQLQPAQKAPVKEVTQQSEQDTINHMRALIEEWEARRTENAENAKGLVNPAENKQSPP